MKKGNITFVILVSLVIFLSGSAILTTSISSRYEERHSYERLENTYISENAVDLSVGLILNYLEGREYIFEYRKNDGGLYEIDDELSPYIFDEVRGNLSLNVNLQNIENVCFSYLSSIGYKGYINDRCEVYLRTFGEPQMYKLSRMCKDSSFVISGNNTESESELNNFVFSIKCKYLSATTITDVKVSGIRIKRAGFSDDTGNTSAILDTTYAKTVYTNYQSYIE